MRDSCTGVASQPEGGLEAVVPGNTHLKLKMGMPLSGWRRKASGVSSTRTMRFMSLPSLDRSCTIPTRVSRNHHPITTPLSLTGSLLSLH